MLLLLVLAEVPLMLIYLVCFGRVFLVKVLHLLRRRTHISIVLVSLRLRNISLRLSSSDIVLDLLLNKIRIISRESRVYLLLDLILIELV